MYGVFVLYGFHQRLCDCGFGPARLPACPRAQKQISRPILDLAETAKTFPTPGIFGRARVLGWG